MVFPPLFLLILSYWAAGQVPIPTPQKEPSGQGERGPILTIQGSGEESNGKTFTSASGGFSIDIGQLPTKTRDLTEPSARARGVDAGKQYLWTLEKGIFTLLYSGAVDSYGNAIPVTFAEMENGSRKGILRANAKLISEKPIKFGKYRGTEFRYLSADGIHFIGRIFLVGDVIYQLAGSYTDEKDEKHVLDVLQSFKLLKQQR